MAFRKPHAVKGLGGGIVDGIKGWFSKDEGTEEAGQTAVESIATGITSNTAQVETAMATSSTAAATAQNDCMVRGVFTGRILALRAGGGKRKRERNGSADSACRSGGGKEGREEKDRTGRGKGQIPSWAGGKILP